MEYTGETLARFVRRYAFLSFGLSLMALGITFSIKGKLGTSPISSLPYVLSVLCPLTVGQASIVMHLAFIAFQIALLRRRFEPEQFVQLPVSLLFGYLMDGWMWALRRLDCCSYPQQWALVAAGVFFVGTGVAFAVASGAPPLPGEGVVVALCRVFRLSFPRTKICFDAALVTTSVILSYAACGRVEGVREGTLAAVLCVGLTVKAANRFVVPLTGKFLAQPAEEARRRNLYEKNI